MDEQKHYAARLKPSSQVSYPTTGFPEASDSRLMNIPRGIGFRRTSASGDCSCADSVTKKKERHHIKCPEAHDKMPEKEFENNNGQNSGDAKSHADVHESGREQIQGRGWKGIFYSLTSAKLMDDHLGNCYSLTNKVNTGAGKHEKGLVRSMVQRTDGKQSPRTGNPKRLMTLRRA